MDILFLIRSIIFLVAGLVTIIFPKELNNLKNRLLIRCGFKNRVKNEIKGYYQLGIVFILIAGILFIVSIKL
ncbi:MAG: hypothetical protein HOH98_00260 [Flavobacteriaceae bacterium]|jgi:hypothetical protein|nr:hypothetical protein [Pelagibacterales bacterium]MBT6169161.1 hypothetical protein [Flavobacteriaceae bacterium]MBT7623429.1 hypothetical protein [Flavobacteriaceae bacterium]|tara:strand:- start:52 stop:267 length:216 start_codon:yes stop_codon:yes gene_type:complete